MKYNLHTHTIRCNHATGEDREYVEAAIKAGFDVLGFADHCPQFFPDTDYYSFFRMKPALAEDYVCSVKKLQKEYANDIKILVGFETEYYPKTYAKLIEFIKPLALDYLIMGQHFIGNEFDRDSYYASVRNDDEALLTRYAAQVIEGIDKGVFTYIAHPDILNYRGSEDFYREKMTELCEHAKALDIPLEYNILGVVNKKCYPNPSFWKIVKQVGNKVVLGYDAHEPKALLNDDIYAECMAQLNSLGITPVDFEEIKIVKP